MPGWLSTLLAFWPVLSAITPLIVLGGFYWLQTKFPGKTDFGSLSDKVDQVELEQVDMRNTLKRLEQDRDTAPTRVQLMQEIANVEGRVKATEARLDGIRNQLNTTNEYLHILVERGLGGK